MPSAHYIQLDHVHQASTSCLKSEPGTIHSPTREVYQLGHSGTNRFVMHSPTVVIPCLSSANLSECTRVEGPKAYYCTHNSSIICRRKQCFLDQNDLKCYLSQEVTFRIRCSHYNYSMKSKFAFPEELL